jgi:hypothetical protein
MQPNLRTPQYMVDMASKRKVIRATPSHSINLHACLNRKALAQYEARTVLDAFREKNLLIRCGG